MARRTDPAPTRRQFIKTGGVVLGGGVVAGCTGGETGSAANDSSDENSEANGSSGTNAGTNDSSGATADATTTSGGGSYSVSMAPMGAVEFEEVPKSLFVTFSGYADMAVALGHGDAVNSIYSPDLVGDVMNTYCARLKGVSPKWKGLTDPLADGLNKEQLYELDSDVHFLDPAYVSTQKNWDDSDVDEIAENVGPWFGNFYSGTHDKPPKSYRKNYEFYSLWDMFEKVSEVLRERERYRKLKKMHSHVISTIESKLPPKKQRPTAVRVTPNGDNSGFYAYHLNRPGYWLADTRPLGAKDAFAKQNWSTLWGEIDYEAMLEADPDVILLLWSVASSFDLMDIKNKITNKPAGKKLTAVENDDLYPAGLRYQGPIMNLFQLEMTAKQLYPDQFGAWPDFESGDPYPQIPKNQRLFDRTKLASIIREGE